MARFAVDAGAALHLASEGLDVGGEHRLLAPTLLRSQVLSSLHEAGHRGELTPGRARELLTAVRKLGIRLLGDAVMQRRAWEVADRLGWESTYDAEYVALTQLQADAFVTLNGGLASRVAGEVATAPVDALLEAGGRPASRR